MTKEKSLKLLTSLLLGVSIFFGVSGVQKIEQLETIASRSELILIDVKSYLEPTSLILGSDELSAVRTIRSNTAMHKSGVLMDLMGSAKYFFYISIIMSILSVGLLYLTNSSSKDVVRGVK